MPDRMPMRMPEDVSDRMPEELPVTKHINVMVGITRSKVLRVLYSAIPGSHHLWRSCWRNSQGRPDVIELTEVSKDIWDWIKDEQNCVLMTLMERGAKDSVPDAWAEDVAAKRAGGHHVTSWFSPSPGQQGPRRSDSGFQEIHWFLQDYCWHEPLKRLTAQPSLSRARTISQRQTRHFVEAFAPHVPP